jgi:class 3 adenylate cyclase
MEPRIRYVKSSDGVNIAYMTMGQGGTPVLMQAPLAVSNIALELTIPELRAWYESLSRERLLVRYDYRGMGTSDRGVEDHSFMANLADLEGVADRLDGPFDLLAFAGGGHWSILYAARHPERVRRLVLWSTPVEPFKPSQRQALEAIFAMAEKDWDLAVETFAHATLGWSRGQEGHDWAKLLNATITRDDFLRSWQKWMDIPTDELKEALQAITAPTLVIDENLPSMGRRHARTILSLVPNAQLFRLEEVSSRYKDGPGRRAVEAFLSDGDSTNARPPDATSRSGTAIILFADIVDSTALTERLGDAAFREKARALDGALREVIGNAGGTTVEGKLLGDGVLAVFTSAREAITAALACGKAGTDGGLPLHLGIHAGDVIREGDNVFGGAVNIAARIAGESAAGEVLVSETVRSLARTSAGVSFEDAGEQSLKGVGEAVRVWAVRESE